MNEVTQFDILLVIPTYRESERLPAFLQDLIAGLREAPFRCAIRLVDDGSGNAEQATLKALITKIDSPILLPPILLETNKGKGGAIRAGWTEPFSAKWLCFVDADGAISGSETQRIMEQAINSTEQKAFFGSRIKMLGRKIERHWMRYFSGRIFASFVGRLISSDVYDSQCGIKVILATDYAKIARFLKEDRFCFDVELLAALLANKVEIVEVPIDWRDIPGSKVSLIRDTFQMLAGLRRIRASTYSQ